MGRKHDHNLAIVPLGTTYDLRLSLFKNISQIQQQESNNKNICRTYRHGSHHVYTYSTYIKPLAGQKQEKDRSIKAIYRDGKLYGELCC